MKIGIIGGGWYGCHVALSLKKKGHEVVILEKSSDIFQGVSGDFGIRLHKGPHYPRSSKTRESCRRAFDEFIATYPELVVRHDYATYALGTLDSLNNPPKVNAEEFKSVCEEDKHCEEIDAEQNGYKNLINVFNQEEPSVAVGKRLRDKFRQYLADAGIEVKLNYTVTDLKLQGTEVLISGDRREDLLFEKVINATGCAAYLPTDIASEGPVSMEVVYQPCLGLLYADQKPKAAPFSFIVMDGWFPCVMPYLDDAEQESKIKEALEMRETEDSGDVESDKTDPVFRKYVLTHGNYTIMASCDTYKEANIILSQLGDKFIKENIQPPSEREINRFWPEFKDRFKYLGWKGRILAKLRTKTEFRSAVTFACPSPIIHIIPGKISNIFDAEREVLSLIDDQPDTIIHKNHYSYVKGGVLDMASHEINERPDPNEHNTCNLNTFTDMRDKSRREAMAAKEEAKKQFTHTVFTGLFCISADNYVVQNTPRNVPESPKFEQSSVFSGMFCISNN